MSESSTPATHLGILQAMTFTTGIVDAASFLALGHVFTANMTGNIVFLGFGLAGAPGLSVPGSLVALVCFGAGAVAGGRISVARSARAFAAEAILLLTAAWLALGLVAPYGVITAMTYGVIAATGTAMGIRNAIVRRLAVPDLTTTVLTLTITGLAADSTLAGGYNPRWQRRCAAVVAMLGGAATGAVLLRLSVALTLAVAGAITAVCALVAYTVHPKEAQQ